MQARKRRHLRGLELTAPEGAGAGHFAWLAAAVAAPDGAGGAVKPPELTWRDYAIMLLHIASSIEHALMVQYLYAAYSLGGEQVPAPHRAAVERWRAEILAVAKEEMGHLLTVQNLLALLGGPVEFDREDYPWDSVFYPAPFTLAPLSLDTLAIYVYAEMPERWADDDKDEIVTRARDTARRLGGMERPRVTRVGVIYQSLIATIADHERIPDAEFDPGSVAAQASWDEWGRGYRAGARDAEVKVEVAATRDEALEALRRIASQGESPDALHRALAQYSEGNIPPAALRLQRRVRRDEERAQAAPEEERYPSHFDRFLKIYRELDALSGDDEWSPARPVIVNPTSAAQVGCTEIADTRSTIWANLFNLRYRMLLAYLTHALLMARQGAGDEPLNRGAVMHRAFAEMYNLKTIAGILVRRPAGGNDGRFAGPPFQMPYTLVLPSMTRNRWRLHRELIGEAASLKKQLRDLGELAHDEAGYLTAMADIDGQALGWLDALIDGRPGRRAFQ
ncbi:MAG TPA: ferritin-like domain-containing protein [Stellaceae bacterium]|nr:ferritin-like domain-containing protein [Stellaceae bacterium]